MNKQQKNEILEMYPIAVALGGELLIKDIQNKYIFLESSDEKPHKLTITRLNGWHCDDYFIFRGRKIRLADLWYNSESMRLKALKMM